VWSSKSDILLKYSVEHGDYYNDCKPFSIPYIGGVSNLPQAIIILVLWPALKVTVAVNRNHKSKEKNGGGREYHKKGEIFDTFRCIH
jgi:hypothetical protein